MNIIGTILSENLIKTLGWTIIHSLWQGAAIAIGFAAVMFFMRRFSARTRHLVGVMALMLILAMSTVTFISLAQGAAPAAVPVSGGQGLELALNSAVPSANPVTPALFFKNYFNRHLPLVVTLWLLGILVLVLRWAGGFLYSQRVKVHRTRSLPAAWQQRLDSFCRQQGFSKPVRLLESALVKIPMTIGHFKPVILFPLGLVTGLPRDQVEALLAHELAHIFRKDYLVNILQHVVEILFFYHPGVHWISTQVRSEREHCCDDMAVSLCGNSLNVARALANLQGRDPVTPVPAMAAAGKRQGAYRLLGRVKRLIRPRAAGSEFAEGFFGAFILVAGLLVMVVSANAAAALHRDGGNGSGETLEKTAAVEEEKEKNKENEPVLKEYVVEKPWRLEKKLEAEIMKLKKQQKEFQELEEELHRLNREPTKSEKEKMDRLRRELKEQELKVKELEESMREHEAEMKAEEAEMREQEEVMKAEEAEMKVQEVEMQKQEVEMRKEEEEIRKQETEMKVQEAEMRKQEEVMRKQEAEMRKQEAEMRKQEEVMRKQEAEMRKQEAEMREKEALLRKVLIKELIQDRLISDETDFEIRFEAGKLFIDGKEQSREVFAKYKKLYEKISGGKLEGRTILRIENRR